MKYIKNPHRLPIYFCEIVLALTILAAGGCSEFSQHYEEAIKNSNLNPADPIVGAWDGQWVSDAGHSGGLKCVLEKIQPPTTQTIHPTLTLTYRARFHARFMGILSMDYDVVLTGDKAGDTTHLQGSQTISGFGGGLYHYDAKVTPTTFDATYKSQSDNGIFRMKRESESLAKH